MKQLDITYLDETNDVSIVGFTIDSEEWLCILSSPVILYDKDGNDVHTANFDKWLSIMTEGWCSERSFKDSMRAFKLGMHYNYSRKEVDDAIKLAIVEAIKSLFTSEFAMLYSMAYNIETTSPAMAAKKIHDLASKPSMDSNEISRWWRYAKMNDNKDLLSIIERIMMAHDVEYHTPQYPNTSKYDNSIIKSVFHKISKGIKPQYTPSLVSDNAESIARI